MLKAILQLKSWNLLDGYGVVTCVLKEVTRNNSDLDHFLHEGRICVCDQYLIVSDSDE